VTPRSMLAVAHEATLTGSPMNLLHLLRWVREHTDVHVHTLVMRDGDLRHRFEQLGPVTMLDRWALPQLLGTVQAGLQYLGSSRAWKPVAAARLAPQLRSLRDFDLIYLNSLPSIGVLPHLPPAGGVVAHAHELEVAYRTWRNARDIELFATGSGPLDRRLRGGALAARRRGRAPGRAGAAPPRVHRCPGHRGPIGRAARGRACRREMRIPSNAAVVVGAGTVDWRKGPTCSCSWPARCVAAPGAGALRVGRRRPAQHRLGARALRPRPGGRRPRPLRGGEARSAALVRHGRRVRAHLARRPVPLVGLECAALGKPIVTYRNGGMPELLEAAGPEAAARVVDHLDVGAMADQVIALLDATGSPAAGEQLRHPGAGPPRRQRGRSRAVGRPGADGRPAPMTAFGSRASRTDSFR
jgi:hypothetical protein